MDGLAMHPLILVWNIVCLLKHARWMSLKFCSSDTVLENRVEGGEIRRNRFRHIYDVLQVDV